MNEQATSVGGVDALAMSAVSKAFPGVQALDNAGLNVAAGEIHGLVGENGAGKSTIIKILAGVYKADSGSISVDGEQLEHVSPVSVRDAGVRFIHQELSLVPHFSVTESVFMGQEIAGPMGVNKRAMRRQAEAFLADTLGAHIDGRTLIRDLSVAQRKLVQIARALVDGKARLVVFDEPTAVLSATDIDILFGAIRSLRDQGITIVYVSHYLSEITEICDRVTVFRNGVDVGVIDLSDTTDVSPIIKLMVGREIAEIYPQREPTATDTVLDVQELGGSRFQDVSFSVRRGEIVGLAGIIGSGREEVVDTLYGMRRPRAGSVSVDGGMLRLKAPSNAVSNGLVLVPRNRRDDGLVLGMSVADNINLASLDEVSSVGWLQRTAATRRADDLMEELDVRPRRSSAIVQYLSGGNQQKVVLARWLATESKVFVLDDPTVGVDIGARTEIYKLIASLAANGAGVLISSNDLAELTGMCDRVLVMVRGRIVADLPAAELTLDELLTLTTSGANGGNEVTS